MTKAAGRRNRLAIGLISGTSMDGVDAALVRISGPSEKPRVRLLGFITLDYFPEVRERLLEVAGEKSTSAGEISQLNLLLGYIFGDAARRVMKEGGVRASQVSVIGSHGQTIYHQGVPSREAGREIASTLQIAEAAVISEMAGVPVVADFRTADMAAGGQGAPLVPMVDYLLLRHAREGRVALNLGGIANITVIPAGAKPEDIFGFDTGPGNMVMDALVRHFTRDRESYDTDGRVASLGKIVSPILAETLRHGFFRLPPPKSAGREQFGREFVARYFLARRRTRFKDVVRTALELTAKSIAGALVRFVTPRAKVHRLIVSGGGARNKFLLERLEDLLPTMKVERSDRYGLPVDAKEAIAFAVLADRTMHGLPGNLPTVTGARRAVVLGKFVRP
jgi:anhydro-N-acetylmuramic acid kinase